MVVPEVNAHALDAHNGIISCPNCSTIQMMVALEPVRQKWGLDRIIVSTYQAVSGAGMGAILETQRELREVLNDGVNPRDVKAEILPSGGDKKHLVNLSFSTAHKVWIKRFLTMTISIQICIKLVLPSILKMLVW